MTHHDIEQNANWLVVGAAPDSGAFFDVALPWARNHGAAEIATNAAWQLYATAGVSAPMVPRYYWISDAVACKLHGRAMRWVSDAGCRVLTLQRTAYGLHERGLREIGAVTIDLPDRGPHVSPYVYGRWSHPRLSGLICLQIAAHHLPTRRCGGTVVLVGMTGYRSAEGAVVTDTIDGRLGKAKGADHTRDWIQPYTQSVVDFHRDITFIVAGKPRYELSGPNVVIAPTPQDLAAALDTTPMR